MRVLGGFDLVRDGQTVRFTGKAQQRPLDLLKLVVAVGALDVDIEHVTAALWPDADGAAAKSSFDAALFRLRKLLDIVATEDEDLMEKYLGDEELSVEEIKLGLRKGSRRELDSVAAHRSAMAQAVEDVCRRNAQPGLELLV